MATRAPVVLAIDGVHDCDSAVAEADHLAADGAPVIVLHVHEVVIRRWGAYRVCCTTGNAEARGRAIVERLDAAGRSARVVTRSAVRDSGSVAREILRVAGEAQARTVVVCSRGRGDLASLTLGSVTHRLIRRAQIPVLAVPCRPATAGVPGDAVPGTAPRPTALPSDPLPL